MISFTTMNASFLIGTNGLSLARGWTKFTISGNNQFNKFRSKGPIAWSTNRFQSGSLTKLDKLKNLLMENSKIQSSFRSAYLTGHKWFAEVIKGASLEASKHSPREVSLIKSDFVIR